MAKRVHRVQVVALNIAMHPHSAETYLGLFERARNSKIAGIMHGNRWGRIASISRRPDESGLHYGRLNTFVDFDLKKPWLDTTTDDVAAADQVRSIQLPSNLKPEYLPIEFAFDPQKHRLFVRAEKSGPTNLERVFFHILNNERVNRSDHRVNVTLVQEQSGLDRVFGVDRLMRLQIVVGRPNPDVFDGYDASIEARLGEQNADRVTVELVSSNEDGLKPDEATKQLAELALANGTVTGRGFDARGVRVKESTAKHPQLVEEPYDPESEDESIAFQRAVRSWPARLVSRLRP